MVPEIRAKSYYSLLKPVILNLQVVSGDLSIPDSLFGKNLNADSNKATSTVYGTLNYSVHKKPIAFIYLLNTRDRFLAPLAIGQRASVMVSCPS